VSALIGTWLATGAGKGIRMIHFPIADCRWRAARAGQRPGPIAGRPRYSILELCPPQFCLPTGMISVSRQPSCKTARIAYRDGQRSRRILAFAAHIKMM